MQQGYFSAAYNDIKNSPGWLGKLLLLALLCFIPIFGWIVVAGYLFGWARDKAWGVHAPLPSSIFGNEDGKLYSRGFFVLLIFLACSLLPFAVEVAASILTGSPLGWGGGYHGVGFMAFPFSVASGVLGMLFTALSIAASFLAVLFAGIGSMRMSIYGRLSAGFQFGTMWNMLRHDFGGMMRILGMVVITTVVMSLVSAVLFFVMMLVLMAIGFVATGGNLNYNADHFGGAVMGMIIGMGGFATILSFVVGYLSLAGGVGIALLVSRALGYWVMQFDVPHWRGQDDPLPFELAQNQGGWQAPPSR